MIEHDLNDQEFAKEQSANEQGACQSCTCETTSTSRKPVVSKRTKLLFIAFGAVGIAAIAIVWGPDFDKNFAKAQAPRTNNTHVAAPPAKNVR
jgi:hypothetical protein